MIAVRRSRTALLALLAATMVAADCASPLAVLGLFETSHRVVVAANGSLVLHHDLHDASHHHALADALMFAHLNDGPDGTTRSLRV